MRRACTLAPIALLALARAALAHDCDATAAARDAALAKGLAALRADGFSRVGATAMQWFNMSGSGHAATPLVQPWAPVGAVARCWTVRADSRVSCQGGIPPRAKGSQATPKPPPRTRSR